MTTDRVTPSSLGPENTGRAVTRANLVSTRDIRFINAASRLYAEQEDQFGDGWDTREMIWEAIENFEKLDGVEERSKNATRLILGICRQATAAGDDLDGPSGVRMQMIKIANTPEITREDPEGYIRDTMARFLGIVARRVARGTKAQLLQQAMSAAYPYARDLWWENDTRKAHEWQRRQLKGVADHYGWEYGE